MYYLMPLFLDGILYPSKNGCFDHLLSDHAALMCCKPVLVQHTRMVAQQAGCQHGFST
jgi:hypothetical protein